MVIRSCFALVALCLVFTRLMAADDYSQWGFSRPDTLNTTSTGANVATTQAKFPVLIRLSKSDSLVFKKAARTGKDIRFSNSSSLHLPYAIDRWDSAGNVAEIWVRVDTVYGNNATQVIKMYWGNSSAADSSSSAAVFSPSNGFGGVWHLNNNDSNAASNSYHGTQAGPGPVDTIGTIGRGRKFTLAGGEHDSIKMAGLIGLNSVVTLSCWAKTDSVDGGNSNSDLISLGDHAMLRIMRATDGSRDSVAGFYFSGKSTWNATFQRVGGKNMVLKAGWKHLAYVCNPANSIQRLFINGTKVDSSTFNLAIADTGLGANTYLGKHGNSKSNFFGGVLDEVRVETTARSADWIKLCYKNQKLTGGIDSLTVPGSITVQQITNFSYTIPASFPVNTPLSISPKFFGVVDSFTADSLPEGLLIDKTTGVIFGTPTTVTSVTNYKITAQNAAGPVTIPISIVIAPIPPANFMYSADTIYVVGTTIKLTPMLQGSPVLKFSSALLPDSLTLDSLTGILSGTFKTPKLKTTYQVIVKNDAGLDTAFLVMTINPAPPVNLRYSDRTPAYQQTVPIPTNTPSSQGGAVKLYSVSPLPSGLMLNTTTGAITGTPDSLTTTPKICIVTAKNDGGSAFDTLSISVVIRTQNSVTVKGSYVSASKVEIIVGSYTGLFTPVPPTVDSVQIWVEKNKFPVLTDAVTKVRKKYLLSTLMAGGATQYKDTIDLGEAYLPSDSVGIVASLVWSDARPIVINRSNGSMVSMRDNTKPANPIALSGIQVSADTAKIFLDSLSKVDFTKIDSISIWYNFTNSGYFSSDFLKTISVANFLKDTANGRYTDTVFNLKSGGDAKMVFCAVRLIGKNGLKSDSVTGIFGIAGQPRPVNPIILSVNSVTSTSINLNWNPVGVQYDSLRIWFGKSKPVPLLSLPSNTDFEDTVLLSTETTFTMNFLDPKTVFYFGAEVHQTNGLWSFVSDPARSTATTLDVSDTSKIRNTAKITKVTLDSAHNIKVDWTVDTSASGGDALIVGLAYSLSGYPKDSLNNKPTASNQVQTKANSGTMILKFPGSEKLLFNTTYYVGLWVRTANRGWSVPPADSVMDTLVTPTFSWQEVTYGQGNDTDFAFNKKVRLTTDPTYDPATDILDSVQFSADQLTGFIPVSIGFSFRDKTKNGGAFSIGVHYGAIPSGDSIASIKMYRYNATSNSFMIDTNAAQYDRDNSYVFVRTKDLKTPFIAMIDTQKPVVTPLGDNNTAPIAADKNLDVSFFVSDNISNVKYRIQYASGGSSYDAEPSKQHVDSTETKLTDTIHFSIPGEFVSQDNGLRACLIANDGVHIDTIDLSRRVIRTNNPNPVSPIAGNWTPAFVTANLDSPSVKSALKGIVDKGALWKYNPTQFRLFRWLSFPGNANTTQKWVEYADTTDSLFTFYPGRLIWIKTKENKSLDFGSAITPSLKDADTIVLAPKTWMDFALPFQFDIKIGDIVAASADSAHYSDSLSLQFYSWSQTKDTTIHNQKIKQYITKALFIPSFIGFGTPIVDSNATLDQQRIGSVFNPCSTSVKLVIPPIPTSISKIGQTSLPKKKEALKGWSVGISGRTVSGSDLNTVYCGYSSGKGANAYFPQPPTFEKITMSVYDDQKKHYAHSISHGDWNKDGGTSFNIALTNTSGSAADVDLSAMTYGNVPKGNLRIALFDPATGLMSEPGKAMHVTVADGACEYRKIAIGSDAYLSKVKVTAKLWTLSLVGVYPNPFKHTLRIQYSIPDKNIWKVNFSIIDLAGREIWKKALGTGALISGPGVLAWNGKSKDKSPTAAGIYIVRMAAFNEQGKTAGVFEKRITYMP